MNYWKLYWDDINKMSKATLINNIHKLLVEREELDKQSDYLIKLTERLCLNTDKKFE